MFELTITDGFASAHFIAGHGGKCKNLHGHTWKVEVTVMAGELDDLGMVADFAVLKNKLRHVLDGLDHGCLNDIDEFRQVNPTTESIAKYIYGRFQQAVRPLCVKHVRVWESETSNVLYYE